MARQRRVSDDIYNARRRIRRAAAAAERRGESERARQLRAAAEQTYVSRGVAASVERAASAALAALRMLPAKPDTARTRERNRALISGLRAVQRRPSVRSGVRDVAREIRARRVSRDNELFKLEINLASQDLPSSIDRADLSGKSQARIFWMSTRKIWQGAPPEQRYEAIMRAIGTDSLRDAFERVLAYNERAVGMAEDAEREVRDTLKDMTNERADEPVSIGSPPEFMYFVRDYSNVINLMP